MDIRAHWERIYKDKDTSQLGWYEPRPETSLRIIKAASLGSDARILDVGGGTSTLVECLLDMGYRNLGVLDFSRAALQECKRRLGARAAEVEWFEADMLRFETPHPWDLWHDRAVLHFLIEEEDQVAYSRAMLQALSERGQAVIATFGPEGPNRCSGLEVRRYDADSLQELVGQEMEMVESRMEEHVTPAGVEQQFLFCRFRRAGSEG